MQRIRKAVVVGGSGGLGATLAMQLADGGAQVVALGRSLPSESYDNIEYVRFNLLSDRLEALESYIADADALIYAAGLGRVAQFDALTDGEIKVLFRTNAECLARVLNMAMPKMRGEVPFYCAVIGSIAGAISSPMFAAYGASKAAARSLCESVNAELDAVGCENRVLHVAPGALKGTRFYGGVDEKGNNSALANEIINRMLAREIEYIPQYEEVYKGVIERYNWDKHGFGVESYNYKLSSGRASDKPRMKVGFLSGTFDLFHIGHLNLLRRAKEYCDYLIVGVHPPGSSHKNKPTFIPFEERMEIIGSVKYVDKVVKTLDEDDAMYEIYPYDFLFVGSDYKGTERFNRYEEKLAPLGVKIIYFPYTQGTSSTQLRDALMRK